MSEIVQSIEGALLRIVPDAIPTARARITHVANRIANDARFHQFDFKFLAEQFEIGVTRFYDVRANSRGETKLINSLFDKMKNAQSSTGGLFEKLGVTPTKPTAEIIAKEAAYNVLVDQPRSGKGFLKTLNDIHIDKGSGLLFSGMFAVGALASAASIVGKEEATGEKRIHITPLMLTLAQGLLATGIAYFAFRNPQAAQTAGR